MEETAAKCFIGVDWGYREHELCALDAEGNKIGGGCFEHSGEGLLKLIEWALSRVERPSELRIAIETPHGAVVEGFLERGVAVYALNPKQLDRFRDRFCVAGAKDDRLDALVLASSLRTDAHAFRKVSLGSAERIQLREWSRTLEEVTEERTRLGHKIREQLNRYYPQMLQLGQDVTAAWRLELWVLVPTPQAAQRVRGAQVTQLLRRYRVRRLDVQQVLETLRAQPLSVAAGTSAAAVARIELYTRRAQLINEQVHQAEKQLDAWTEALSHNEEGSEPGQKEEQHDAQILQSLPGVGRVVLAVLLSEAHEPLCRGDYHAVRKLAGVAPVTQATGGNNKSGARKKRRKPIVKMRQACQHRLRNAVWHWARIAMKIDPRWRQRYTDLRGRGLEHSQALRTVGDSLLRVACAMIRHRSMYEPSQEPQAVRAA